MRLMFVYWPFEDQGSGLVIQGYSEAARALGHEVVVYGRSNPKIPLNGKSREVIRNAAGPVNTRSSTLRVAEAPAEEGTLPPFANAMVEIPRVPFPANATSGSTCTFD